MVGLTISEIAESLGYISNDKTLIKNISTDSRSIGENSVFVAIQGETFDGHNFVVQSFEKGAKHVVVNRFIDNVPKEKQWIVKDTKQALIDIAGKYRSKFNVDVVAVTGSVGKTTTKEMIWTVLSGKYKTLKTEGNFNNEIGMPRTIFGLDNTYEKAVIEMGMSARGDVEVLSLSAKPKVGVITNIGVAHIEYLGSRQNILRAKTEIIEGMEKGSPLILCGDNDLLKTYKNKDYKIYTYGIENKECDVVAEDLIQADGETWFNIVYKGEKHYASIPTIGKHNVLNALCAFMVGTVFEISFDDIINKLKQYKPTGMRQNVVMHNGFTVVEDCYNASPDSMKAAIKTFTQMPCSGKKYLVLSDMLELGARSKTEHYNIGEILKDCEFNGLFCIGEMAKEYINGFDNKEKSKYFENKDELTSYIKDIIKKDDMIWFKASRGMKLEDIIQRIYKEC